MLTGPEALGYARSRRGSAPSSAGRWSTRTCRPPGSANSCWPPGGPSGRRTATLERFDWIRQGGADTVTDTVREITGAGPRPLAEWLGDSREAFDSLP